MKKLVVFAMAVGLALVFTVGCGGETPRNQEKKNGSPPAGAQKAPAGTERTPGGGGADKTPK